MQIEREPRRRLGEKVNMFHPEYPRQEVELSREAFDTKLSEINEKIEALADPKAQEILNDILGLFRIVDKRVKPAENLVVDAKKQILGEINSNTTKRINDLANWREESGKKDNKFG